MALIQLVNYSNLPRYIMFILYTADENIYVDHVVAYRRLDLIRDPAKKTLPRCYKEWRSQARVGACYLLSRHGFAEKDNMVH